MRELAGRVDNQGQPLANCPVVVLTRNKTLVPNSSPPVTERYVVASAVTAVDGSWHATVDIDGPLLAVAWDPTNPTLQPIVLEPIL